jgi:hypothetical protein
VIRQYNRLETMRRLMLLRMFPHDNVFPNTRKHQQIFMDRSIVSGICLQVKDWSLCCIPVELPHEFCCESQVQWASLWPPCLVHQHSAWLQNCGLQHCYGEGLL